MLTVVYDPKHGHAVRDGDLMKEWKHLKSIICNGHGVYVNYATDNIINFLRVMVKWGLLPVEDFRLQFQRENVLVDIEIDRNGNIEAPRDFCVEALIACKHLLEKTPVNPSEDMYYE